MLKLINVIAPWNDKEGYALLIHLVSCGMLRTQIKAEMEKAGYYVPEDMIECFDKLFDMTIDLDIGSRQYEVPTKKEQV